MSESALPMFSSKSFIVSGFTFRILIHFKFIFVLESVLTPVFYRWLTSFPAPLVKEILSCPLYIFAPHPRVSTAFPTYGSFPAAGDEP